MAVLLAAGVLLERRGGFSLAVWMLAAAGCLQAGQDCERARMREIEEACDIWQANHQPLRPMRCQVCGCPEFSKAAGHLVCICCGAVLGEDGTDGGL